MFYVYIICNEANEVYVGVTKNLRRRIRQHRRGACISTRKLDLRWKVAHKWIHPSFIASSKLERFLHRLQKESYGSPLDFAEAYPFYTSRVESMVKYLRTTKHEKLREMCG